MTDIQDAINELGGFFGPAITAFILVTFSPLRRYRQPARFLLVGLACSAVAAFFSIGAELRGAITNKAVFLIVGISFLLGAIITLLTSSESITEKKRDELVRKSDDQSWRL